MKRFNLDQEQSAIFDKHGAFFAFSQKQFDEGKKPGILKYSALGAGLLTPQGTEKALMADLKAAWEKKISFELENNSRKEIIFYELANRECQLTFDLSAAIEALEPYGITEEEVREVWPEYHNQCIDNDCF